MAEINQELLHEFMASTAKVKKLVFQRSSLSREDKIATMLQFQALKYLSKNPKKTVGELATELMLSSGAVAQLSDRLVNNGWVDRKNDQNDKRIVRLLLTSAGEEHLQEQQTTFEKEVRAMLINLSEQDIKDMIRIQTKILQGLEANQRANA